MARCSICCLLLWLALLTFLPAAAGKEPLVDGDRDPLPSHALARLGTIRFWHGSSIRCLAYAPEGKFLASGGYDGLIHLWDARSGQKIRTLQTRFPCVAALAISPGSKFLVSASHDSDNQGKVTFDFLLWNVETGKVMFQLGDSEETKAVAFSPDGKRIASGNGSNTICLWDAQTGKLIHRWKEGSPDNHAFTSFVFAPDGKKLATTGSELRVLDLNTNKGLTPEGKSGCHTMAYARDGTILAMAGFDDFRLFRASTLTEIQRFDRDKKIIDSITFFPDGKTLVSSNYSGHLCFWDIRSGKKLRQLPNQSGHVQLFALSPDGKTLATKEIGSWKGVIRLWDAQTGTALYPPGGHLGEVKQTRFLADGETVMSSWWVDTHYTLWQRGTDKESSAVELPQKADDCLLCPDRSTLAAATGKGMLRLLDLPSGKERACCPVGTKFQVIAVSADNKRAAVKLEPDRHLEVWDLTTNKILERFKPAIVDGTRDCPVGGTDCLGFSPNGQMLALNRNDNFCLWDLETHRELWNCETCNQTRKVAFSPDARMIATQKEDLTIQLWETVSGKVRLRFQGYSSPLISSVFSPDGKTLAVGSEDGTVRLWDVQDGKSLCIFRGHLHAVSSVDFSPDGRRLVSRSDDTTALIWSIPAAIPKVKSAKYRNQHERNDLWCKLTGTDSATAYTALQRLALGDAEVVALVQERLFAMDSTLPEQIQRWITQLDDEDYTVREQASLRLERVNREAEKPLKKALQRDCSPEVKRRLDELLERLKDKPLPIHEVRAVELLEQIGTVEAVEVLRCLAQKTGDDRLLVEAQLAIRRLEAKRVGQ